MTEEKTKIEELSDSTEIRSTHTFFVEQKDHDLYFCKCGNKITKDKSEGEEVSIRILEGGEFDIEDVDELSTRASNIVCDKCGADYSKKTEYSNIVPVGKNFIEKYIYLEDDNRLTLYKYMYRGEWGEYMEDITILNSVSYIAMDKSTKKIYFKDFYDKTEYDFTLDKVFKTIKRFYNHNNVETSDGLFCIHSFLNRVANFVSDSHNMNIVQELMSQMIGKAGIDILIKVNSIFFSIICYPNISTIALTKGTLFLYDMLDGCNLPNPSVLSDEGATSPLKIFNFLVNIKNEEIKKELDSQDRNKAGYVFTSKSGQEHNITYDGERFDDDSGKVRAGKGEVFVRDDVAHKSVSPYIFKNIKRFSDYEALIRYTKFISYQDLVNLVVKYDADFLLGLLDSVEFRYGLNMDRMNQFINIAMSFLKRYKRISENPDNNEDFKFLRSEFKKPKFNFEQRTEEEKAKIKDDGILDFSLLKYFDLGEYDDCLRMIASLKWDVNKEFYRIKDVGELEKYHDQLVEHFNMLSDKQKNKNFMDSTSKYKFLEEYKGDLRLRVIDNPEMLLSYAKSMKNCAGSYVNRIATGQYVLFIIEDLNTERKDTEPIQYMFGLNVNKHKLEFDQVKAACNVQGSDRFKKQVMTYLEDKDISYKELSDLKLKEVRSDIIDLSQTD